MKMNTGWILALGALTITGCANMSADQDTTVCEDATEHVRECFPDREVESPDSCDPETAERTLQMSCEQLDTQTPADGFCNPWLWWTCTGSDSDSGSSFGESTVWVRVETCMTDICHTVTGGTQCTRVVIENEAGDVLESAHTSLHGSAKFSLDPDDGPFVAKVYRRDGTLAESMTEREFEFGRPDRNEAVVPFELEEDEQSIRIYVSEDERDQLGRCADLQGSLTGLCEGDPMDPDEVEWSWFVRLSGENPDGEFVDYIRPFNLRGQNEFHFSDVLPGDYEMTFVEMEIPDYRRENNPEYEDLVDYYDTGRTASEPVTVSPQDANRNLELGDYQLDYCQ